MVIATSDSNGTLISLNAQRGKQQQQQQQQQQGLLKRSSSLELFRANNPSTHAHAFQPTHLLLPDDDDFDDDDESFYSCSSQGQSLQSLPKPPAPTRDCLYLPVPPKNTADPPTALHMDECLPCLPCLQTRAEDLLAQTPVHFTPTTRTRVLYVGQQEAAHAVPLQCDVVLSDKATTCHVLILRSSRHNAVPLTTVAHLDGTSYDNCVRTLVQRHLQHHFAMDDSLIQGGQTGNALLLQQQEEEEKKQDSDTEDLLELDVHILGGFLDANGTSREISNWLLRLLAEIAQEHAHRMVTTLQTCVLSAMNDDGHRAPRGRGLGIDVRTGRVFLATCDAAVAGPDLSLRALRLWRQDGVPPRLAVIHEVKLNMIQVAPFDFLPFDDLDYLLSLPDAELLQYTSTSPHCEDANFCHRMRATLVFLRDVSPNSVFGPDRNRTRYFKRLGFSNTWKALHA